MLKKEMMHILSKYSEKSCINDGQSVYTYDELRANSKSVETYLENQSVKQQAVVAIQIHNSFELVSALIGIILNGNIPLVLHNNIPSKKVESILNKNGIGYLLTLDQTSNELKLEERECSIDNPVLKGTSVILTTSGSTGDMKLVCLSADNIISNVEGIKSYIDLDINDRSLIYSSISHASTFTGVLMTSLFSGAEVVMLNQSVLPNAILKAVEDYRISYLTGVPTLFKYFVKYLSLRKRKIHDVQKISVSGEIVEAEVLANIRKFFDKAKVFNSYGLTETSPRLCYLPDHYDGAKDKSVGIPLPNTEVVILDENLIEVDANKQGQLYVKSPSLMLGYLNPGLSQPKYHHGYFPTGDIGYKDTDGFVYVLSRSDDLIIRAGMNISPLQVENVICKHDLISDALVYGQDCSMNGKKVCVEVILTQEDSQVTIEDVRNHCSQYLSQYEIPTSMTIVEEFKKTLTGKKDRKYYKGE